MPQRLRSVQPLIPPKSDFELNLAEHANCGHQIMVTFKTDNAATIVMIPFFVHVPAALFFALSGEEDLDIPSAACELSRSEVHSNANSFAVLKVRSEILTAAIVINVPTSVVAVYTKTSSLPPR